MPGVTLTDHLFSVPLDHDRRDGEHIEIYAREVVATGRERERLPWLLFLQGGPGMLPPRPVGRDSWLDRALDDYRVLLLDRACTARTPRTIAGTRATARTCCTTCRGVLLLLLQRATAP